MSNYRDCDIPEIDPDMPEESLAVSDNIVNFEDTYVRTGAEPRYISITNNSAYDIYFKKVVVSSPFKVNLMLLPQGLKPNASGVIEVSFFPTQAEKYQGKVTIELTRGYSTEIVLNGEGIQEEEEEEGSGGESGGGSTTSKDLEYWEETQFNGMSVLQAKGNSPLYAAILPKGSGGLVGNTYGDTESRGKYTLDLQFNNMKTPTVAGGDFAVITGGKDNTALGQYSFIGSGTTNYISGQYTVNITGSGNNIEGEGNIIGTGTRSELVGTYNHLVNGKEVIVNGNNNALGAIDTASVYGDYNFVGSGKGTNITGSNNALVVSSSSTLTDTNNSFSGIGTHDISKSEIIGVIAGTSTVKACNNVFIGSGSALNATSANNSAIVSGTRQSLSVTNDSVILAGEENSISNSDHVLIGACKNVSLNSSCCSVVLAGENVIVTDSEYSVIATGAANQVKDSFYSFVITGSDNSVTGSHNSAILTGVNNTIEGSQNEYSLILNGNDCAVYNSNNCLLSGYQNQISNSDSCHIISSTGSFITECIGSYIAGGNHHTIQADSSAIISGSYNQVLGKESIALGGHRNTLEGADNVALGGNYGSDFGISHHVFQASKEGTNWQQSAVDTSTGNPTGEEPEQDTRACWYNNNPLFQTGSILMQAMDDPSKGFYEGTSSYKKYFYTHSDKYVQDGIWGTLPACAELKTLTVPNNCALFWSMHIYLFDFASHKGEEIICQNGIISNKDNELSIVNAHSATAVVDSVTNTQSVIINTNNEDLSVNFELPVEYKDYIAAAKLTYTLLTSEGVNFYWE